MKAEQGWTQCTSPPPPAASPSFILQQPTLPAPSVRQPAEKPSLQHSVQCLQALKGTQHSSSTITQPVKSGRNSSSTPLLRKQSTSRLFQHPSSTATAARQQQESPHATAAKHSCSQGPGPPKTLSPPSPHPAACGCRKHNVAECFLLHLKSST